MDDKKVPKSSNNIYCKFCDYYTCRYSQYERHLMTSKHKRNYNGLQQEDKKVHNNVYICECGNVYKHRQGLWKHKQKCNEICNNEKEVTNNNTQTNNNTENLMPLVLELVRQNSEFKELLLEQNKYIVEQNKQNQALQNQFIELAKEKSNITNTNCHNNTTNNNNHFNLQLFLNERCKNAMNINEFVEQIPVNLNDLEDTARLGYVEGISRIFINGLKQLEVNERPIHCSDAKRETLYIKDGDIWEKDDINKTRLETAIRKVAHKNMRMIPEWRKKYPDCHEYDSTKNDLYLKIVSNSMCGGTEEETENNYNKIKKNIIKEVIIDK
jgi:hypothetical protein